VAGGLKDSSLTRVRPYFDALTARDPSSESWLRSLLGSTPHGESVLRAALQEPGRLDSALATRGANGLFGCFEFGVGPPKQLLRWYLEHPDKLVWPKGKSYSSDTIRMREALLFGKDPGRAEAQREALEFLQTKSTKSRGWWRFEGTSMIDCVLMTPELVVTIEGKRTEPLSAATDWYPKRSQLVRNLEAAKQLANGRSWAAMVLSESPMPEASDSGISALLPTSAPHLDDAGREELREHYLGNLTWQQACDSTGLPFESLPRTTADL
jgi:hypothetical protein